MLCLRLVVAVCAVVASVSAYNYVRLRKNLDHLLINTQYAGVVTVGSQSYLLVFDTSSPNVILASPDCIGGSCSCASTVVYSGNKRGNGLPLNVTYFDTGKATGKVITDSLSIVNLTSPQQGIVLATELSIDVCLLGASGVAGLAPTAARTNSALNTIFDNFARQHLIPNIFSVHHARYPDGEHFGELVLGGSDERYVIGEFTTAKLVEPTSWKFKLDQVLIGSTNVAGQNTLGFIDTSKNIILGPKTQVDKINQAIGCTPREVYPNVNLCVLGCNQTGLPPFAFIINGTRFNISSEYYVQRNGNICYSGFKSNGVDYYMIGDYFLDHYYSEFNEQDKVMRFATAVEEAVQ